MSPNKKFIFLVKQPPVPKAPGNWTNYRISAQTEATFTRNTNNSGLFAHGGYFSEDVVALRTLNTDSSSNYSEFSIYERSGDTWSNTYAITGSDVTTTAGNGVWFIGDADYTGNDFASYKMRLDGSTTYDEANKTLYVLASTASTTDLNHYVNSSTNREFQPFISLFKTTKTGGTWSALQEVGVLASASTNVYPDQHYQRRRTIHYMTNDGTIASRGMPSRGSNETGDHSTAKIHFTNPSNLVAPADTVPYGNFDPSGENKEIRYWSSLFGVNHNSTKVFAGGRLDYTGRTGEIPAPQNYNWAVQIIGSGSANGWEIEGTITASAGQSSSTALHVNDGCFHFNDTYAVFGIPRAGFRSDIAPYSTQTIKQTGGIFVYKKTGDTWADHDLVFTMKAEDALVTASFQRMPLDAFTRKIHFGHTVKINEDNDIMVTAPSFYNQDTVVSTGQSLAVGCTFFLTASGTDTWGLHMHHTGAVHVGTEATPESPAFRAQYLGNKRAILMTPDGDHTNGKYNTGFALFKDTSEE